MLGALLCWQSCARCWVSQGCRERVGGLQKMCCELSLFHLFFAWVGGGVCVCVCGLGFFFLVGVFLLCFLLLFFRPLGQM